MANQAWQVTSRGKITLTTFKEPIPTPGPKQILLRVHAAALNYRDQLAVDANPGYPLATQIPLIPCSDGAGVVEELGRGSKWKKGDRLVIQPNDWLTGTDVRALRFDNVLGAGSKDGTLRRWMIVDDEYLFRAPASLSLEEASTLFTAGNTAWNALHYGLTKVKPRSTVLTMGTGGVSCYAIMIAAAAGATVIATSSSDDKLDVAKKLGATHLINYNRTPDWASEVLKITNGLGVDIVADVVGTASIEQTIRSVRFGGMIAMLGMLSEDNEKAVSIMLPLLYGAKTLWPVLGAGSREMAEELSVFVEKRQLHPPIAHVFDFEEADKALEAANKLSAPGKVVIRC